MKPKYFFIFAPLAILAVVGMLFLIIKKNDSADSPVLTVETQERVVKKLEYLYDIPVDSFEIVTGKIGRNQMLGNILDDFGVTQRQVYEISQLPQEVFNVRKIKSGNPYTLFVSKDSLHSVKYFVYEDDRINYYLLTFGDSISVVQKTKPVEIRTVELSGEIRTSLWESFIEQNANPIMAVELSEIYAWSIDFFGLQPGDQFKVIYDEAYVDSLSAGVNRIHCAWFFHSGHQFWAFPFIQDSVRSFFDEEGNSLRKAFLKAPLRYSRISSGYSHSRLHPILKIRRPHHGVDYAAPYGTPVHAVGDGQIIAKTYERGGGNYVKIKHNSVYTTAYLHLSKFGYGLKVGDYVKQGDVIGYVGSTGLSTGPHLDFRFYRNGYAVNPLTVEAPPVEPVLEENWEDYELVRNSLMQALETID